MIYDCFPFFNEFELLAIRLNELAPVVDKFVIVESSETHAGSRKPLWFLEKRHYFRQWEEKIVPVVTSLIGADTASREQSQRQAIWLALQEMRVEADDMILMGDADEIVKRDAVGQAAKHAKNGSLAFGQSLYQYFLNANVGEKWLGTRMASVGFLREAKWSMHEFRHQKPNVILKNSGWHFGFMGGAERVRLKINSYMHQEFNLPEFTDLSLIQKRIDAGVDPFDRSLTITTPMRVAKIEEMPVYVRDNPHLYANWLK